MSLFESVPGGRHQGAQPLGQQQEFQDFVKRYEQGPPWAGISEQEAVSAISRWRPS
jgi:hypothetical protein